MALTAIEQLRILAGEAKPDQTDFKSLILQVGAINGTDFIDNAKDVTTDEVAESYYNKYVSVITGLFNKNTSTLSALERVLVVLMGKNTITFTQVQNATDVQWEAFVVSKIGDAIDIVGKTTDAEKAAYDAL